MKRMASIALLLGLLSAGCAHDISLAPGVPIPAGTPQIAWLAHDAIQPGLDGRDPLGRIERPDGTPLATVTAGWNAEALELLVRVNDAEHVPASDDGRLWSADSIEVGIDAAGDGSGTLPADTRGAIAHDDFKFIFGLINSGPATQVLTSRSQPDLAALRSRIHITRTPAGQTIYRLSIPWSLLNVVGGARPSIGLDLQINDRNAGDKDKAPFNWGDGLRGGFVAARLHRFVLGTPPSPFVALDWGQTTSWDRQTPSSLYVGMCSDRDVPVKLKSGGVVQTLKLPGANGWQFHKLSFPTQPDGAELIAQAARATPAIARQTVAEEVYQNLQNRLKQLLARPGQHPLFVLHLRSLSALISADWARVQLGQATDPRKALSSIGYYRDLLAGLNADTGDWQSYLDGRRSLVIAYVSPHDQSTQYYGLGLPRDWNQHRAYPLFFELHGAGDSHPMSGVAWRLSVTAKTPDLAGYDAPKVYAEIDRAGFWVQPFGRGNLGYTGIARYDILEAYDHVHELVKIDPNRRYLYGFSMGGGGAFNLAIRTPSRWAAVSSIAPATNREPAGSPLTPNLATVPYQLLCGEEDDIMKQYREILDDLSKYDIHPTARSIPKLGHNYLGELQREQIDWLKTHVRTRPASFSFVASDNLTNTCWGVTLQIPSNATELARAVVRCEGQNVELTTSGANAVLLDFSAPDGLGLVGEVTVIWNGRTAYHGRATPQRLMQQR